MIIYELRDELTRLGISYECDSYSGVSVQESSPNTCRIFDDYDGGKYLTNEVLNCIKKFEKINYDTFWNLISEYEV